MHALLADMTCDRLAAGDCLGNGYDPPRSVTVLLDSAEAASGALLKPADDLVLVWMDESVREDKCLSLWKARAPARWTHTHSCVQQPWISLDRHPL